MTHIHIEINLQNYEVFSIEETLSIINTLAVSFPNVLQPLIMLVRS